MDLTARAVEGFIDPVIGRDTEIQRIVQILCRRTKNNCVLLGEPGVGKTAMAEGLAIRIAEKETPNFLWVSPPSPIAFLVAFFSSSMVLSSQQDFFVLPVGEAHFIFGRRFANGWC